MKKIDCLFVNPRDLVGADAYIRLASLAAVIRQNGYTFKIIEPAAEKVSREEILQNIEEYRPAIVCIGAFPSTLPDAYLLSRMIKQRFPDIVQVLEGYHVNADPSILREIDIPFGVHGDAEFAFLHLCRHICSGHALNNEQEGLILYQDGVLTVNRPGFIKDIHTLPMAAYDSLPIGRYYSASTNKVYMKYFSTRGCPYDCNFCASAPQMKYRYLEAGRVVDELEILVKRLGVEWVEFMDLTFTMSRKRTIEICDEIVARNLVFDWGCETRADKIDEELLQRMKAAGCKKITFGVESGSEEVRYRTGKRISNRQFIEAFQLCHRLGLKTMANFIFGHPGETASDMEQTVQFARTLKPFNALFLRMIPLPDVDVFKQGVQQGTIPPDIWVRYMKGECGHPVYYPESVTPAIMDRYVRTAYTRFYLNPSTIASYMPLFTNFRFVKKSAGIFFTMAFGKPVFK